MTNVPITNVPITNVPMTNAPMTNAPMTNAPMTNAPMTNAPMTNAPMTNAPMTNVPMTNIILIGFRGTGKSTISTLLAERLGMKRVSTDERATEHCGMSIRDFVEQRGWAAFRQIEQECIREAVQEQGIVIDCGGGVVENAENMRLLSDNGVVVWVHAELEDVLERLMANEQDVQRPTLTAGMTQAQDITENYQRRILLYEQYAALTVNTSLASAEECCRMIMSFIPI